MDQETQKVLREGEKMAAFVKGDEWAMVKDIMVAKIMDFQSIMNIDGNDPVEIAQKIQIRQEVVTALKEIIQEVEGRADQHRLNLQEDENEERLTNIYEER